MIAVRTVTTWEYLHRSQFRFDSMQNWQSEFLAVASIVLLSVYAPKGLS